MTTVTRCYAGNSAYRDVTHIYAHIVDPNERRRLALAEIDKSSFGWSHVRAVVVAGVGFFTDAYDIFAINLTTAMFGLVFWQHSNDGVIPSSSETAIKVATAGGTVVGQIVFGYLADLLGRKRIYGIELMIMISTTLAQSLSAPSTAMSFVGIVIFWRVVMGIGVGGDYPMSAVITSEFANTKWRGGMIAAVFAMQGLGQFAAAALALVVTAGFKDTLEPVKSPSECGADCMRAVDIMWRIVIGFGGVPGWFALYYRLTIPETPRYTFDVAQDLEKASADIRAYRMGKRGYGIADPKRHARKLQETAAKYHTPQPSLSEFVKYMKNWRNSLRLFGTAGSWFFLDIAFYGLGLNNSSILSTIGFGGKENVYQRFYNSAVGNLVLVCAGIPGYWATVATVDIIGRRIIQTAGFAILTLLFGVIGFGFHHLSSGSLLALYVLCQFFFNFGPNATTFIIPAESFPTRFRATAHGISAASGKIGAIIAQVVFAPMQYRGSSSSSSSSPDTHRSAPWLDHVMQIFSLFMLCGVATSLLIPETKRQSLEELAGEPGLEVPLFQVNFVSGFFVFRDDDEKKKKDKDKDKAVQYGGGVGWIGECWDWILDRLIIRSLGKWRSGSESEYSSRRRRRTTTTTTTATIENVQRKKRTYSPNPTWREYVEL